MEINDANAALLAEEYIRDELQRSAAPPLLAHEPRGIVICAGGPRYLTNAYVLLKRLRALGCTLPVELWHLGPEELNPAWFELAKDLGPIEAVDAREVQKHQPHDRLNGWELKPYAVQWCNFQEVLLIDADNVPVRNPEFVFDSPEYREAGTVFWPDYTEHAKGRRVWKVFGVQYRQEPQVESGQVLVDKRKAGVWQALQLANWYCGRSAYFFDVILGDKETFHFAWRKLEQSYAMPPHRIRTFHPGTMGQNWFDGELLFLHRNMSKWRYADDNPRVAGFKDEDACLDALAELRASWSPAAQTLASEADRADIERLSGLWNYERVTRDARPLQLRPDGTCGLGSARCERYWTVRDGVVAIAAEDGRKTLTAEPVGDELRGAWLHHEKMPVVLTRLS